MNKFITLTLIIGSSMVLIGCEVPPASQSSANLPIPVATPPSSSVDSSSLAPSAKPNFTITVTLASPQDLKVKKGDAVTAGQILSQNSVRFQELTQFQKQLEAKLKQKIIPILVPNLDIKEQQNALAEAKLKAAQSAQEYQRVRENLRFTDSALLEALDTEKLQKMQTLQQQKQLADQKISTLTKQIEATQKKYLTDLSIYQQLEQRRQQEVQVLVSQIQGIKTQLKTLPIISPISGKVSKINYLEQKNQILTAKIILEPLNSSSDTLPPLNLPDVNTLPNPLPKPTSEPTKLP